MDQASTLSRTPRRQRLKSDWLTRLARRQLGKTLEELERGRLIVVEDGEQRLFGDPDSAVSATITLRDPRFWTQTAFGGSLGAAEAYMDGDWECDDLVSLVRILVLNRDQLDAMEGGLAKLAIPALRLLALRRNNSRAGSRRNIAAHYDLGNDFFRLMLDRDLSYSSAWYGPESDQTLEQAQFAKLDRICRKLDLRENDSLVEIGTGWGSFAIHAAQHYGARVTTTTISRQQYEFAARRIAELGLEDRINLLEKDYRDLEGRYDKLVSIEMIEAVGANHLDSYMNKVGSLLKRDGLGLIQAITIEDDRYERAVREVDFIKRHIFPGSFIPSTTAILSAATRTSNLHLFDLEDIGLSYARTLNAWRANFHANEAEIRSLGYPERFMRMWDFYLAYCEGGFIERSISDVQLLFAKPDSRRVPLAYS